MDQTALLIAATLASGTPLALAGLGLLINERAGILNLGAEGLMLVAAVAGIATALAIEPALPRQWQAGQNSTAELPPIRWKRKALASLAYMAAVKYQLRRLSQGRRPNPGVSPLRALLAEQLKTARRARQYRRLMASA